MRAALLAFALNLSLITSATAFTGSLPLSPFENVLPAPNVEQRRVSKEEQGLTNRINFARLIGDQESLWSAYDDLGEFLHSQHRYAEAQVAFKSAIEVLQPDDRDHAIKLGCEYGKVANVLAEQCKFGPAEMNELKALTILNAAAGPQSIAVGVAYHNLAFIRQKRGDLPGAETFYAKSLDCLIRNFGKHNTIVGLCCNDFAQALTKDKKYAEAITYYERAVAILQNKIDDQDTMLQIVNNYIFALRAGHRLQTAHKVAQAWNIRL